MDFPVFKEWQRARMQDSRDGFELNITDTGEFAQKCARLISINHHYIQNN